MRLGASRKGCDLLVPHMNPFDLSLAADRIGQPIQAVADDAVDPLDAGCDEHFSELICYGFCHSYLLSIEFAELACGLPAKIAPIHRQALHLHL
jgi:hypothetical protein